MYLRDEIWRRHEKITSPVTSHVTIRLRYIIRPEGSSAFVRALFPNWTVGVTVRCLK